MKLWTIEAGRVMGWETPSKLAKEYGLEPKRLLNQISARGPFSTSVICGGVTVYTENPMATSEEKKTTRAKGSVLLRGACTHGMGVWRDVPR